VSDQGQVRSLRRTYTRRGVEIPVRPRLMKLSSHDARAGHLRVGLRRDNKQHTRYVHRLVAEAFHGAAPEGKPMALHRNDDKTDNRAENLYWGDAADNMKDMLRNGIHSSSGITHCPRGHEYTPETTYLSPAGHRSCRVCRLQLQRTRKEGPCPDEHHGSLTGYTGYKCRCDECRRAWSEYLSDYRSR
jgi:hypothetical protein